MSVVLDSLCNTAANPLQIKDTEGNEYGRAKDVAGEKRMAFTSHADAAFDVCFINQLNSHSESIHPDGICREIDFYARSRHEPPPQRRT
jgi:hypothetical protein